MPASKVLLLLAVSLVLFPFRSQASDPNSASDNPCPAVSPGTTSCPIRCFRVDPVCGADGLTYWCGCPDAACAGARVVHVGACKPDNSASGLVPHQALLLVHIVWLFVLGFAFVFGLF